VRSLVSQVPPGRGHARSEVPAEPASRRQPVPKQVCHQQGARQAFGEEQIERKVQIAEQGQQSGGESFSQKRRQES